MPRNSATCSATKSSKVPPFYHTPKRVPSGGEKPMRKKLNWCGAGHSERLRAQHSTAVTALGQGSSKTTFSFGSLTLPTKPLTGRTPASGLARKANPNYQNHYQIRCAGPDSSTWIRAFEELQCLSSRSCLQPNGCSETNKILKLKLQAGRAFRTRHGS